VNIIQILWKLGYDVLSFNEDGEYKIQFGKARKALYDRQIADGTMGFDGSTDDIFEVKVDEVGFNGFGDLYVSFSDVNTGKCMDFYEYKNMGSDELF
jgi:hypothetical protein